MPLTKKLYIASASIGGLAALVFVYIDQLREYGPPGVVFDVVVLLYALSLSILFVPIGLGVGAALHVALSPAKRYAGQPRSG